MEDMIDKQRSQRYQVLTVVLLPNGAEVATVSYDRLHRRLENPPAPALATLPDGSVDHFATITAGGHAPLSTRAALADEVSNAHRSSFRLRVQSREKGGQAVNAATQAHALGSRVTCYGHLDDPVFEDVPYRTISMGEPATVYAFTLADGDIMLAENAALDEWTVADLERVVKPRTMLEVDAVCCGNWVTFRGLSELFRRLGAADTQRVPFVVDPGDIVGLAVNEIADLFSALGALQSSVDVVYTVNRGELRESATAMNVGGETDRDRLAALRAATDLTAIVLHAPDEAVAATAGGVTAVPTPHVEDPARFTGGGDRFDGGMATALAAGWDWATALACGNACASHFVRTGETADTADVRAVSDRLRN